MFPPTSICANPNQPPPQHFSMHAQQYQPQTGSIPPGSTTQYVRAIPNGGGVSNGPGSNDANGFHPPHQQMRNFQPQQQPTAPPAVTPGQFGHVFMLAQAFPNATAPPPGHFSALPPLNDRQFQQQTSMPSHQDVSSAPSLLHQQLMQPIIPPTSICTNPYQPPPQHFPIHTQQYQPQTVAIPPGSTTQYIRTFSNGGGGGGGPGNTDANGSHINGFHPPPHQHVRSFQPQQQPPAPTSVNPGIGQQPFGPQPFFMLPHQTFATAPPPGPFDAITSLGDRQFQQQPSMPSLQLTSTAPSLLNQHLMQQLPQVPPPQFHQQPPPQSAPPHHQSPQFQQQTGGKEKRPLSIQAPGSTEGAAVEQTRDGNQSGRQSAVFSDPSPQLQNQTSPTPTDDTKLGPVKVNDIVNKEEVNVEDDYRKRQNRHPSFSNKNGGNTAPRSSFHKFSQQPSKIHNQSQDVRNYPSNINISCPECGIGGHTWNFCPRIKRERDESILFAEVFEQRAFHPALKNNIVGNAFQNNNRRSDNHQQQNVRGGGFSKNFGQRNDFVRHQRYSSGGVGGGGFSYSGVGANKPVGGGSGFTPTVRPSGFSGGDGSGGVNRQGSFASGGSGRKDHQKSFYNKKFNKTMQQCSQETSQKS